MSENNLKNNFMMVIKKLNDDGMKPTQISQALGYTTTAQLRNVTADSGIPSSKAIMAMIENLKVHPLYLFLGKGDMFIKDKNDEERLKVLNDELKNQLEELEEKIKEKEKTIRKLKDRQEDLLELLLTSKTSSSNQTESGEPSNQEQDSPD